MANYVGDMKVKSGKSTMDILQKPDKKSPAKQGAMPKKHKIPKQKGVPKGKRSI